MPTSSQHLLLQSRRSKATTHAQIPKQDHVSSGRLLPERSNQSNTLPNFITTYPVNVQFPKLYFDARYGPAQLSGEYEDIMRLGLGYDIDKQIKECNKRGRMEIRIPGVFPFDQNTLPSLGSSQPMTVTRLQYTQVNDAATLRTKDVIPVHRRTARITTNKRPANPIAELHIKTLKPFERSNSDPDLYGTVSRHETRHSNVGGGGCHGNYVDADDVLLPTATALDREDVGETGYTEYSPEFWLSREKGASGEVVEGAAGLEVGYPGLEPEGDEAGYYGSTGKGGHRVTNEHVKYSRQNGKNMNNEYDFEGEIQKYHYDDGTGIERDTNGRRVSKERKYRQNETSNHRYLDYDGTTDYNISTMDSETRSNVAYDTVAADAGLNATRYEEAHEMYNEESGQDMSMPIRRKARKPGTSATPVDGMHVSAYQQSTSTDVNDVNLQFNQPQTGPSNIATSPLNRTITYGATPALGQTYTSEPAEGATSAMPIASAGSMADKITQVSTERRLKQLEPPVMYRDLPASRPLTLCFEITGTNTTHRQVLLSVMETIEHIPEARVCSLQFGARNVMLGTMWVDNRWIIDVSTKQCVNVLIGRGVQLNQETIKLRRYDDVIREEYEKFQQYLATRKPSKKSKPYANQTSERVPNAMDLLKSSENAKSAMDEVTSQMQAVNA